MDREGLRQRDRDVVTTMQDAFLPVGVVALPRVDVAARYLLCEDDRSAGGDWFDTVPLGGGRVGLVVGDVVGQGISAASTMGQLRAVLSAARLAPVDPVAARDGGALFAAAHPEGRGATAAVAVIDPTAGERASLHYGTAGHPPPLVVRADGSAALLPVTGGGPFGSGTSLQGAAATLGPGDLVLLYTDGLLVRPGAAPERSLDDLLGVAAAACRDAVGTPTGSTAEATCERTLERLTRETGVTDDVTVLAAQLLPGATEDLVLDLSRVPYETTAGPPG